MNEAGKQNHVIDMIFVIALLFMFAMSALMLVALGSSIYRRSVDTMQAGYERRTAYAYISEKLRQYDCTGSIGIESFQGNDAIRVESTFGDTEYVTRLYAYDGALMELMARKDAGDIPPEQGQRIMDITSMEISAVDPGILRITLTLPGDDEITFVTVRRSSED